MTDCKHDWHFNADLSEGLTCSRCGAKTAPRTPEQRMEDLLSDVTLFGMAWQKNEQRIDPTTVYKFYEPPKPVGAWVIDPSPDEGHGPSTMFHVFRKPTDEQIKNTEQAFGWKWKDLA
jgi:hypothetical protein